MCVETAASQNLGICIDYFSGINFVFKTVINYLRQGGNVFARLFVCLFVCLSVC